MKLFEIVSDLLYCIGGYNGNKRLTSCERYNPKTNKWNEIAPLNQARSSLGCVEVKGAIYAIG